MAFLNSWLHLCKVFWFQVLEELSSKVHMNSQVMKSDEVAV